MDADDAVSHLAESLKWDHCNGGQEDQSEFNGYMSLCMPEKLVLLIL